MTKIGAGSPAECGGIKVGDRLLATEVDGVVQRVDGLPYKEVDKLVHKALTKTWGVRQFSPLNVGIHSPGNSSRGSISDRFASKSSVMIL